MASIPPKANDVLHEQSKPTTETYISSGSSLNHEKVEKIDRIPSYDRPVTVKDSTDGDLDTTDVKYGTGVEEKAMSASEDASLEEGEQQSKLRTLWIKYRWVRHIFTWLVATG